MPDIRDVLNALDETDRKLYAQARTRMRAAYIKALSDIVGMNDFDQSDDQILDWIDVKISSLFDRAGRFEGKIEDVSAVEKKIVDEGDKTLEKAIAMTINAEKMNGGWTNGKH